MQQHADELLKLRGDVDVFLVSNGPNYYVQRLADEYRIPYDRVCCSDYFFNKKSEIIERHNAITVEQKSQFVQQHRGRYDVTIGVGDNGAIDGPFLSQCTFAIMTERDGNYLYAESLNVVSVFISKLQGTRLVASTPRPSGPLKIKDLIYLQNIGRLSWDSWMFLFAGAVAIFYAGLHVTSWLELTKGWLRAAVAI